MKHTFNANKFCNLALTKLYRNVYKSVNDYEILCEISTTLQTILIHIQFIKV